MCICSFVFHSLLPLDVCLCVWWPQHGSGNLSHPGVSWNPPCPQTGQANFHTFHIFHFWASLWQLMVCGTWVASWNQVPQSSRPPASPLLAGDHFCPNAFATCPKRATLLRLPPCHLLTQSQESHLATSGHFLYSTVYLWQAEPTHYFFSLITLHHIPSWPF